MSNKPKTDDEVLTSEQADKWRERLGLLKDRSFPGREIPMYSLEEGDQSFDEGEDTGATTERLLREEISDLKRKLSDSIAREQEIERELQECKDSYMQLASLQSRHYEERNHYREQLFYAENNLSEERARADALTGALDTIKTLTGEPGVKMVADKALTTYRNREKGNE